MKKLLFCASLLVVATPVFAQHRMDIFFDVEGVRRNDSVQSFSSGTRFDPRFGSGGGIGGGLNFFFTDRMSLEAKVAALATKGRIRIIGSDSIVNLDLGYGQIYPISAVLQWHMTEHGTLRPYLGAGIVYTILRNINKDFPNAGFNGVRFNDPTGLVVDGGLELSISKRWSAYGDARYVPIDTKSRVTFPGSSSSVKVDVRPLILSVGLAFKR